MKILVISDSHGRAAAVMEAVELEKPDALIHLGDGNKDLRGVRLMYPDMEVYAVAGNCDFYSNESDLLVTDIQGVRLFLTHGHMYSVKQTLKYLLSAAADSGARIALYGHTHEEHFEKRKGITVINPGSLGYGGTYGILTIDNGKFSYEQW